MKGTGLYQYSTIEQRKVMAKASWKKRQRTEQRKFALLVIGAWVGFILFDLFLLAAAAWLVFSVAKHVFS